MCKVFRSFPSCRNQELNLVILIFMKKYGECGITMIYSAYFMCDWLNIHLYSLKPYSTSNLKHVNIDKNFICMCNKIFFWILCFCNTFLHKHIHKHTHRCTHRHMYVYMYIYLFNEEERKCSRIGVRIDARVWRREMENLCAIINLYFILQCE